MFKPMIAALIAATALVPPAVAQRGDRGDRGQRSESNRGGNEDRGSWRQRGDSSQQQAPRSNWRQSQPQQQQVQPAPQQQVRQAPPQQQYQGNRGDRRPGEGIARGQQYRGPQANAGQAPQQQYQGNRGDRSRWQGQQGQGQQAQGNRGGRDGQRWNGTRGQGQQQFSGNRNRGGEWRGNDGRGHNSSWSRNWRNDGRYNWRDRRANDRNRYRLPRYYAPRGYHYGYNRFSVGITLGSLLFSQQYWLNDPYYYGLPPAYGQYRWVRYYNDALLVDIYTGMVVDVEYDIFW